MKLKQKNYFLTLLLVLFCTSFSYAQISSPEADGITMTNYSSGSQDNIYIFCSSSGETGASLTAEFQAGGAATFEWFKYNSQTGTFESYPEGISSGNISEINNLEDGAYRVNATDGSQTETYTAWVFNDWYIATSEITESTCDYFQITTTLEENEMFYSDLNSGGQQLQVIKDVNAKWETDGDQVAVALSPQIFNPPPRDTEYTLTVSDNFGCEAQLTITYHSIVTEASFIATPTNGEAPLEVTFTNESENADEYDWFFFRDLYDLILEGQNGEVTDSIMERAIDENPVYTFENSGTYNVKLVTTKYYNFNGESGICTDTFYIDDYIVVDTSFVDVPNVFTPNGDGANDEFVVQYWSLKEISIKIFNRWGQEVFDWKNNNVQGFDETVSESVWDGKINGRYASPGVYYYVIEAIGRDDKKRNAHGFVHLFRDE